MPAPNKTNPIMMIGTNLYGKGGVSSVVKSYSDSGIMDRLGIAYYSTYRSGTKLLKIFFYITSLPQIIFHMPKYEIVHVHTASWWSFRRLFFVVVCAKLFHKKVVIHLHGGKFDEYYEKAQVIEKKAIRYGYTLADRVVIIFKDRLRGIERFCDPRKVVIIPNGVSVKKKQAIEYSNKITQPYTLVFMGDLIERKGIYDLIQAIKKIDFDESKVEVLLCGNGDIEEITKYVHDCGLDKIIKLPGWVSGARKQKILDDAYLFILPSYAESLPVSILEAMAANTPVIATAVGGMPDEVIDGVNGFIIPVNNPDILADRIKILVNDEVLWHHFSRNACEAVRQKFSIELVEENLSSLYRDLE